MSQTAQGVLGIPKLLLNLIQNPGPTLGGVTQGLGKEAARVLPVSVNNLQKYGIPINASVPMLNPGKSFQAFYDKPLSTTLDALALTDVAGAGKAAPTTEAAGASPVSNLGNKVLASQSNLSPTLQRILTPSETFGKMADYGITNINKFSSIADKVTGEGGLFSKLTREAVSKANPVETGAIVKAGAVGETPSILDMAKQFASDPNILPATESKFVNFVEKGLSDMGGGPKGSITKANPSDVFGFIQDLEKQAASVTRGRSPAAITAQDIALKNGYLSLAGELKDRLFIESGANNAVLDIAKNPDVLAEAKSISPKLADNLSQAKTVSDLRAIQSPFVKASQIAEETASKASSKLITPSDILAGAGGAVAGGGPGGIGMFALNKFLESNMGKSLVGGALRGAGSLKVPAGVSAAAPSLSEVLAGASATQRSATTGGVNVPTNNQQGNQKNTQSTSSITPHSTMDYIDYLQGRKPGSTISREQVAAQTANMAPPLAENVRQAYETRLGTPAQQAEAQTRADADRTVANLQTIYQQNGIASKTAFARALGPLKNFIADQVGNQDPNLRAYNSARDAAALSLVAAYADKGTRSSIPSFAKAIEMIPSSSDTPEEAATKWGTLRTALGLIK